MDHQVMGCLIREVDIAAVDIYDYTSLYFRKIVHDCADVSGSCVHIMIIIVGTIMCHVKFRVRSVCSKSTVMGNISVDSTEVSVTEVVTDISVTAVSEIMSAMTEVVACMSEIMSYIVTGIEVVAMTEIVSVATTHIVTVHVARVGCRTYQQKNKLEDKKYGEYDGDACEDLLWQIHCFKPIRKKFHLSFSFPQLNLC
jgi:hypothetical protein